MSLNRLSSAVQYDREDGYLYDQLANCYQFFSLVATLSPIATSQPPAGNIADDSSNTNLFVTYAWS